MVILIGLGSDIVLSTQKCFKRIFKREYNILYLSPLWFGISVERQSDFVPAAEP